MIILIILLSGCASQNNQKPENLPSYTPPTHKPSETAKPKVQHVAPQESPEIDPQKEEAKKIAPTTSKPAVKKKVIYKNNYVCNFEKLYKVYSAESTDNPEGQLKVNIKEDIVTVQMIAPGISGTFKLKMRSKTGMSMIATNKSMVYQYTFYPQKFTFNTGIAASGFDLARGGHQGNQMRVSGKCH